MEKNEKSVKSRYSQVIFNDHQNVFITRKGKTDGIEIVDRPTQLICISDIYLLYVNIQIQKTYQGNLLKLR